MALHFLFSYPLCDSCLKYSSFESDISQDVLDLVQYLVHAPPAILQVLGIDTAQGKLASLQTAIISFLAVTWAGSNVSEFYFNCQVLLTCAKTKG